MTPSTANISEKPRTKYTVLRKILSLVDFLIVNAWPLKLLLVSELWTSFMVVSREIGDKCRQYWKDTR